MFIIGSLIISSHITLLQSFTDSASSSVVYFSLFNIGRKGEEITQELQARGTKDMSSTVYLDLGLLEV